MTDALRAALSGRLIALYGGTGILGRGLVARIRELVDESTTILSISRTPPEKTIVGTVHHAASVLDRDALMRVPRPDIAIYIAGPTSNYATDPVATIELGTTGFSNFLEHTAGAKRRVLVSSARVYGPRSEPTMLTENAPHVLPSLDVRNIYDATKLVAETLACTVGDSSPISIARLTNVYGGAIRSASAFLDYVEQATRTKRIEVRGSPTTVRNHVHIADACEGIMRTLAFGANATAYNIGGVEHVTNGEFATAVAACFPSEVEVTYASPNKPPEYMMVSIDKARTSLGYVPRHILSTSLAGEVAKARELYQ